MLAPIKQIKTPIMSYLSEGFFSIIRIHKIEEQIYLRTDRQRPAPEEAEVAEGEALVAEDARQDKENRGPRFNRAGFLYSMDKRLPKSQHDYINAGQYLFRFFCEQGHYEDGNAAIGN